MRNQVEKVHGQIQIIEVKGNNRLLSTIAIGHRRFF